MLPRSFSPSFPADDARWIDGQGGGHNPIERQEVLTTPGNRRDWPVVDIKCVAIRNVSKFYDHRHDGILAAVFIDWLGTSVYVLQGNG